MDLFRLHGCGTPLVTPFHTDGTQGRRQAPLPPGRQLPIPVRILAMPITNSNLMAISIPIDADHHRSEATLD